MRVATLELDSLFGRSLAHRLSSVGGRESAKARCCTCAFVIVEGQDFAGGVVDLLCSSSMR